MQRPGAAAGREEVPIGQLPGRSCPHQSDAQPPAQATLRKCFVFPVVSAARRGPKGHEVFKLGFLGPSLEFCGQWGWVGVWGARLGGALPTSAREALLRVSGGTSSGKRGSPDGPRAHFCGPTAGPPGTLGSSFSAEPLGPCQPAAAPATPAAWRAPCPPAAGPPQRRLPCTQQPHGPGQDPRVPGRPRFLPAFAGTRITGSPRGRSTSTTSPRTSGPSWQHGWPSSSSSRYDRSRVPEFESASDRVRKAAWRRVPCLESLQEAPRRGRAALCRGPESRVSE